MQQFVVPQFIDVEDRIIGPITTRQFIIMIVFGVFIFVAYKLFDFTLFVFIALALFAFGGTLAFVRINGQPFHYFLLNLIQTSKKPGLRVWDKELNDIELRENIKTKEIKLPEVKMAKPILTASHLAELSLVVNTGGVYGGEEL